MPQTEIGMPRSNLRSTPKLDVLHENIRRFMWLMVPFLTIWRYKNNNKNGYPHRLALAETTHISWQLSMHLSRWQEENFYHYSAAPTNHFRWFLVYLVCIIDEDAIALQTVCSSASWRFTCSVIVLVYTILDLFWYDEMVQNDVIYWHRKLFTNTKSCFNNMAQFQTARFILFMTIRHRASSTGLF